MANKEIRFVQGAYIPPQQDDINNVNASIDNEARNGLGKSALITGVSTQAKSVATQAVARIGAISGNRALQRNIQQTTELVADGSTIALGFIAGGPVGGVVAIGAVGVQRAFKEVDRQTEIRNTNLEAEQKRQRNGRINERGGFR